MIQTEEQRRWWFANHPEFSSSHRGGNSRRYRETGSDEDKVNPKDVDAYVDEALKYESGVVAELLKSVKRNFGTHSVSQAQDDKSAESGWDTEAGGRTGRRETGRGSSGRRGRGKIRDWLLLPRRHIEAMEKIEAVLAKVGANPNNYRLTEFRGRLVAQRDNIFNPNRVDKSGVVSHIKLTDFF